MQSVDAYTMFMVWTLAPHMVDTQSQTVLFKSVIPVPNTPSESPVNRNVILWDDTRYFQKPLDQAYHGDCSHATASSGTVASVSKLHQSDMGHPRMSSGCLVSPKNRKDRRISIFGLKEASSRSVGWPDPNVFLLRSLINPIARLSAVRGPPKPLSVQPIPFHSQQRT